MLGEIDRLPVTFPSKHLLLECKIHHSLLSLDAWPCPSKASGYPTWDRDHSRYLFAGRDGLGIRVHDPSIIVCDLDSDGPCTSMAVCILLQKFAVAPALRDVLLSTENKSLCM